MRNGADLDGTLRGTMRSKTSTNPLRKTNTQREKNSTISETAEG
jgi:hypothetical protein